MNRDWFKKWFASDDYLDVYRHRNSEDTKNLVSLILSKIEINTDANVLDAACGAGRHSIKFAEMGFNVTGFDLSQTLLNIAIKDASEKNLNINFQNADLRSFTSNIKFDLILSLFTSFGYFNSDEENFAFIKNAFQMLNKNGYYILDYLNKNYLEDNLVELTKKVVDDKAIVENRTISDGRVLKRITIAKENHNSEYLESVKLYSYKELVDNFNEIGFRKTHVFGDYFGNAYNEESSDRCIIIFQK